MLLIIAQWTMAVYLILIGSMMETKNLRSALLFKVLPTVLGIFQFAYLFGWRP